MNPTIRDYGTHLRTVYKTSLNERFAAASAKDVPAILKACEEAAREGHTQKIVTIDMQIPQETYNAHICTLLHEFNLDATFDHQEDGTPNYRRVRIIWV